jgi:hypothetical protein
MLKRSLKKCLDLVNLHYPHSPLGAGYMSDFVGDFMSDLLQIADAI